MPPPLGAGGNMFSGCPSLRPSVRPKPEIPSFDLHMGPLVHPTNRDRFTACPSVRSSVRPSVRRGFWAFAGERIEGMACKFYMLMYLDHLQNWLVCSYGLLIFLIFAVFWLNELVKFRVSGHFSENAWREWLEILHADVSWPPSEQISSWSRFVHFSNFGTILT